MATEQAERGRNLILTSPNCDVSISAVTNKLNELLGTKLKDEHLHYITRLKSEGLKKIVFYSKSKPDLVFREKRKLKGKQIWLTEDLTITNAKFAYLARQAVKKGHAHSAHSTWTTDGRILVKKT